MILAMATLEDSKLFLLFHFHPIPARRHGDRHDQGCTCAEP